MSKDGLDCCQIGGAVKAGGDNRRIITDNYKKERRVKKREAVNNADAAWHDMADEPGSWKIVLVATGGEPRPLESP